MWVFLTSPYSEDEACRVIFIRAKDEILNKILDNKSLFIKNYQSQSGYLRFVEGLEKTESMDYVFDVVFESINEKEREKLGWQKFQVTVEKYKGLRIKILDEKGELRSDFLGMEGYA